MMSSASPESSAAHILRLLLLRCCEKNMNRFAVLLRGERFVRIPLLELRSIRRCFITISVKYDENKHSSILTSRRHSSTEEVNRLPKVFAVQLYIATNLITTVFKFLAIFAHSIHCQKIGLDRCNST